MLALTESAQVADAIVASRVHRSAFTPVALPGRKDLGKRPDVRLVTESACARSYYSSKQVQKTC